MTSYRTKEDWRGTFENHLRSQWRASSVFPVDKKTFDKEVLYGRSVATWWLDHVEATLSSLTEEGVMEGTVQFIPLSDLESIIEHFEQRKTELSEFHALGTSLAYVVTEVDSVLSYLKSLKQ